MTSKMVYNGNYFFLKGLWPFVSENGGVIFMGKTKGFVRPTGN
jgi:predicted mannosyl-3-phosphoglycerate phosphatase (HAD superfamily)